MRIGIEVRSRTRQIAKILLSAVMLVQGVAPSLYAVADAVGENRAGIRAYTVHIEAYGTHGCPRVHDEGSCVLCQLASAPRTPACAATPALGIGRIVIANFEGREYLVVSAELNEESLARAPPTA